MMKGLVILILCSILAQDVWSLPNKGKPGNWKRQNFKKMSFTSQTAHRASLSYNVDGFEDETVDMEEVHVRSSHMKQGQNVFQNKETGVICSKKCKNNSCKQRCIINKKDVSYYVTDDGDAIEFINDRRTEVDNPPDYIRTKREVNPMWNTNSTTNRNRRQVPNLTNVQYLRIIYHPDAAFMDIFKSLTSGNAALAQDEAEDFIILFTNEMTARYQTLGQYDIPYTIDGTTYDMNFAIYVMHIEFPAIVNNNFINPSWSNSALSNGVIYDGLYHFGAFAMTYNAPFQFEHQAMLTGHPLNGAAGRAWVGTVCQKNAKSNYTISENSVGYIAWVVTHELAHALGIQHDDGSVGCELNKYIMSPSLFRADNAAATYFSFSVCAAIDVQQHFSRLTDGNRLDPDCMNGVGTTDSGFLDNFCRGYTGSTFTPNQYCKIVSGPNSSGCYSASGYVATCLPEGAFGCTGEDGLCYYILEVPNGMKCEDSTGNKVCYNGVCESDFEICPQTTTSATTTTTSTTTTTTPATTTTTSTTTQTTPTTTPTTITTTPTTTQTTTTTTPTTTTTTPTTTQTTTTTTSTTTTNTPTTTTTTVTPTTTTTTPTTTTTTQAFCTTRSCCSQYSPPCSCCGCKINKRGTRCVVDNNASPVTTTASGPQPTTTASSCTCSTRRCCKKSQPPCCSGCVANNGRCQLV